MSKRILSLLLCAVMVLGMVACGAKAPAAEAPSADVAMQYITPEDAKGLLDDAGYVFFDICFKIVVPIIMAVVLFAQIESFFIG